MQTVIDCTLIHVILCLIMGHNSVMPDASCDRLHPKSLAASLGFMEWGRWLCSGDHLIPRPSTPSRHLWLLSLRFVCGLRFGIRPG